jgi:hypothetical protein
MFLALAPLLAHAAPGGELHLDLEDSRGVEARVVASSVAPCATTRYSVSDDDGAWVLTVIAGPAAGDRVWIDTHIERHARRRSIDAHPVMVIPVGEESTVSVARGLTLRVRAEPFAADADTSCVPEPHRPRAG